MTSARELLEVQNAVLEQIAGAVALPDVLDTLVRGMERLSEGMKASVLLVDGAHLRHGAAPGLPAAYNAAIDGLEIGPGVGSCGTAAHSGQPVVVEDIATDPLWRDFRELAAEHDLAACWSAPVLGPDGAVLATFALYYHRRRAPTDTHRSLVEAATHLCAVAIQADNARRERLEEVFRQAPAALVVLRGPEHSIQFMNDAAGDLPAGWRELARAELDQVYASGRSHRGEGVPLGGHFFDLLYAPVRAASGEVEGVVAHAVEVSERVRHRQILEQAYETERRVADTLQQALLPRALPAIDGVALAARYEPAPGLGWAVGGDFYDAFPVGDKAWLLVLGDVCGKGPDAAALTALMRYTLRAEAFHDSRPDHLVRVVNRAILTQLSGQSWCTLVCARLDLAQAGQPILQIAAAGHPAPLLVRADGSSETIDARGAMLGIFERPTVDLRELELRVGDTLVLYTDGLLEGHAPAQILWPEDLLKTIVGARHEQLDDLLVRLHASTIRTDLKAPRDDIAILAARIGGITSQVIDPDAGRELASSP
jgi:serine phosphatase RsbU (regulator of sigma subunit)/PAS domain-containing protein